VLADIGTIVNKTVVIKTMRSGGRTSIAISYFLDFEQAQLAVGLVGNDYYIHYRMQAGKLE